MPTTAYSIYPHLPSKPNEEIVSIRVSFVGYPLVIGLKGTRKGKQPFEEFTKKLIPISYLLGLRRNPAPVSRLVRRLGDGNGNCGGTSAQHLGWRLKPMAESWSIILSELRHR